MPKGVYERRADNTGYAVRTYDDAIKHGYWKTPTYKSWTMMKQRCLNPNAVDYPRYGGRGIEVCESWMTFKMFLADMGERPTGTTLDRIDNDGNYEPGNCQWSTPKEQAQNRRQMSRNERGRFYRGGNG